jgi:hypothetical protein
MATSTHAAKNVRKAERFFCEREPLALVLIRPDLKYMVVSIRDISLKGTSFLSPVALQPGTHAELPWEHNAEEEYANLVARVVHATPKGDGVWHVGCEFEPHLEEAALQAYLKKAGSTNIDSPHFKPR